MDVFNILAMFVVFVSFQESVGCERNSTDCCCKCSQKDELLEGEKETIISIPSNYVKTYPPIDKAIKPLNITVTFDIWAIREVSAYGMNMEVDLYVSFTWMDYRLKINHKMLEEKSGRIPLGNNGPLLWHPFVQFRNCKGCKPLDIDPNTFITHYDTTLKALWTVIRKVEQFSCNIDLSGYPMDRQICRIQLENYYEPIAMVKLLQKNKDGPFEIKSGLILSDFKVDKIEAGDCVAIYGVHTSSCLELVIYLSRHMGYHLTTTYAPTIFIVLLSWISFWLPADVAPARITLGVTTLLTLATRLDQVQKNLPSVSYVKAIDVWMFACIFLVFASVIEFALSFYSLRLGSNVPRTAPRVLTSVIQVKPFTANSGKLPPSMKKQNDLNSKSNSVQRTTMIDAASRILFPISFLLFNIVYWSYYLTK